MLLSVRSPGGCAGRGRRPRRAAPAAHARPLRPTLQEVLASHEGDRERLLIALTKLKNDDQKLEPDAEGLESLVALLLQVGCRRWMWGAARLHAPAAEPPLPHRRRSCRPPAAVLQAGGSGAGAEGLTLAGLLIKAAVQNVQLE